MMAAKTRIPAITHCHARVREGGETASRRACISGVEAARRAAPRPPSTQKTVISRIVSGGAYRGMTTGMSAG